MNKINLAVAELDKLQPLDIATNEHVREKFIQIYEARWSSITGMSGEAFYESESRNFNRILGEKEDIRNTATRFSIYTAFLDVAINGLSIEQGARALAYLVCRSICVGNYIDKQGQTKKKYETHCIQIISGYGELLYRERCGQIRHADNPVIVYAEDEFEFGERNGNKFANYTCRLPHTSGNIIACFIKITRADGTIDYSVMLPEDWGRLAGFSERQNGRYDYEKKRWVNGLPNALYGKQQDGTFRIDTGFLKAKCIKHAFATYPKARVGRATQLESQQVDQMEINDDIYGLEDGSTVDTVTGEIKQKQDTGFAPAPDTSAGVTVNPETSADNAGANDDVF